MLSAMVCGMRGESPADRMHGGFSARDLLELYPNVRADRLRCLERWGFLRPSRAGVESRYSFADLAVVRQASAELARGVAFRGVLRRLQAFQDGQLALDFSGEGTAGRLVPLSPAPVPALPAVDPATAADAFDQAVNLDEADPAAREEAARLYRRALEADPACVPALVNLANLHHASGNLVEAEVLYERAIRFDPRSFEAHYNLGNVHYDLDHLPRARDCYERALLIDASCADAHFYLAVTLEKLGCPVEARPHWRIYRQLAPNGEWAELASEFSE